METEELEKIRSQMISQMRRGVLELCILSIVSKKEAYPSDIIEELKATELIVKEGTLYPLLSRLKDQGLLQYNWKESNQGPPRKYFSITDSGQEFLNMLIQSWEQLMQAVNYSLKNFTTNE